MKELSRITLIFGVAAFLTFSLLIFSYSQEEAKEAVKYAREILKLVKAKMEG